MLYALGTPLAFITLVVAYLVSIVVHGVVQRTVSARLGDRATPAATGRSRLDPRAHLDPFGAVAAAIGGLGWGTSVPLARRRPRGKVRFAVAVLAGPLANIALGVGATIGFLFLGGVGAGDYLASVSPAAIVHGNELAGVPAADLVLLVFGVALIGLGLLALVPIPPLDGARLLFAYAPRSIGWQRAEHYLAEQNWGVIALLVLLVLPLANNQPLLLALFDIVGRPILSLIATAAPAS